MHAPQSSTPLMRVPMKKAALVSVVALATASSLFTGCKRPVEKADQDVSAAITKGSQALDDKPDASTALAPLSGAANNKAASDPSQSSANLIAGLAELQAADAAIAKLDDAQIKFGRLVGRINELAARVQANNVAVAGLVAQDPKATLAAISLEAAGAKGGDKVTWTISKTDTILPTLDAADKSIADLTKQIADLKAKHDDLEKQRNTDLQQADQLAQQSEQAAGKKSVDLFKQAADLRKAGAELANQIISADAVSAGLERDLAVAQSVQKQLKSAVDKLDDQAKQVTGGWTDVQKRIDEYTASSKAIVEGAGTDAPATPATNPSAQPQITSIKQAGDELEQTAATVAKFRTEAITHLDKAAAYFGAADRVNSKVQKEYAGILSGKDTTAPLRQAWEWMIEIHNSSDPDIQRAQVHQRMARIFADQAWFADTRIKSATALKDILTKATVAIPKSLEAGELDKEMNDARAKASQAFVDAEKLLTTTIDRRPQGSGNKTIPALKQAAQVAMMAEQYARWAYTKATGDEKKEFLTTAKELAATLSAEGVPLPSPLPPEIAPAVNVTALPTAPVAAPTTGPAAPSTNPTGPATAPAVPDAPIPPSTAPATAPATPDATVPAVPAAPAPADATPKPDAPAAPKPDAAAPAPAAPADTTAKPPESK
ncbi:MAG: hypothetical protein JWM97_1916 [Phycisphaerales bacterium]|nr:hypothetical protein [Phycisphaerales bacterium]